jgi:RNA polymerase sigma factor (sigma-70 family)
MGASSEDSRRRFDFVRGRPASGWSDDEWWFLYACYNEPERFEQLLADALRIVRSPDAAEDVVAEVLFDLFGKRRCHRFDPERGSFHAYLRKAIRHRACAVHERAARMSVVPIASEHDPDQGPPTSPEDPAEAAAADDRTRLFIQTAIGKLSPLLADAIRRRFFQDPGAGRPTRPDRKSAATQRQRLRRALRALRKLLGPLDDR